MYKRKDDNTRDPTLLQEPELCERTRIIDIRLNALNGLRKTIIYNDCSSSAGYFLFFIRSGNTTQ